MPDDPPHGFAVHATPIANAEECIAWAEARLGRARQALADGKPIMAAVFLGAASIMADAGRAFAREEARQAAEAMTAPGDVASDKAAAP